MRTRLTPLLLFAAVAIIAVYVGRPSSHPAPAPASSNRSSTADRSPSVAAEPDAREEYPGASPRRRGNRSRPEAQPGAFDFYLLNLSWSPEFCATHPGKPECAAHPRFVLHGLWPQNNDGTYPENCSSAPGPANPGAYTDIFPDSGLLGHEWQTHGTCSGLPADSYFTLARNAIHEVTIPASLAGITQSTSRPPDAILADFRQANPSLPAASLALSCGNNTLTAIEVCLDKNLTAVACSNVRSCRANTVTIVPPGGS